jgi:V/A-type H+-transporting ATPase subunit F
MKRISFITPEDAEYGFRLTGVQHISSDRNTVPATLTKLIHEQEAGIIIIDERLLTGKLESLMNEIEQSWQGILLVLPSPRKREGEFEDFASRLMRRAIGYHVRLRI